MSKLGSLHARLPLCTKAPSIQHVRCSPAPSRQQSSLETTSLTTLLAVGCKSHNRCSKASTSDLASSSFSYNEALRLKERRVAFDADGLCRLAAESVSQSATDVVSISKLAEGGFNRIFVVAFRDGLSIVARVPYPHTVPKYYAVASEVATIEYQRSLGIPVPEVYGYSADSNNAAGVPYILMQFVNGQKLSDVWRSLGDEEVVSVIRQLTQLESRMMSQPFPAGGSLYFTKDLEKVARSLAVPLNSDKRFCVGPDTKLALWYGRREGLDVNRGPYHSADETLAAAAQKEVEYLKHFGKPMLPVRRERRPSYKFQPESPSYHVENLQRYLSITSSLIPRDPALSRFCIRHADLHTGNIFVSRSPGSDCKIISILDWQHTSILPMFLNAGIPQRLQNHADPVSQSMTPPTRPEKLDEMGEAQRDSEEYRYRRRLVHHHYVASTKECNPFHYTALTDRAYALRGRLFQYAGAPWEGETHDLKEALIDAANKWEALAGGEAPCPIEFDADDLRETAEVDKELRAATRGFEILQNTGGVGEEGWVPVEDYENAVAFFKGFKERSLADAQSVEERAEIMNHWPWDDMDEEGCF